MQLEEVDGDRSGHLSSRDERIVTGIVVGIRACDVGRGIDARNIVGCAEQCRKRADHREPAHTRRSPGVSDSG